MKLDVAVEARRQSLDWASQPDSTQTYEDFQASTWVKLLELPSLYSFDEALLLCQLCDHQWLAWIPDHGEAVLHLSQIVRS